MPDGKPVPGSVQPLWKNRNFRNFLIARCSSALGDSFAYVAIPLLVLQATHSVFKMGLVTALSGAASAVSGIFSGVVADRVNRRFLLISCDVAHCLLYAAIPIAWLFSPQLWLIYLVVPLAAVFSMLFSVTYVTAVPAIVDSSQITAANGRLYASYALEHHLGYSDKIVGYVLAAGFVGTFAGSALVARVRKRMGFGGAWISTWALAGVAITGIGLAHECLEVAVLTAVMLVGTGIAGISSMSLRQEITPDHLLGRVTAAFWTIPQALGPLGAAGDVS
jgi:MFS family permease